MVKIMFKKVGYSAAQITPLSKEAVLADPVIVERMTKLAHEIKSIAPRSDDFLYFSIIFLKSAESALIDDAGNLKKVGNEKAWGYFDENWKWHGNVKAHRNNNQDIFPELELKKAHMNWVGKPLCKDHESSSVDGIRGIILDTYYDDKMKQVVGLCALDRVNYADLAKKVETGIVRYGSMGTAVETSVCSDCLNFAKTAEQYCFVPDTKITMSDGRVKNIKDIMVGDTVLSADGKDTTVLKLFENKYAGDLLRINSSLNGFDLITTPNHPILSSNREDFACFYREKGNSVVSCFPGRMPECSSCRKTKPLKEFSPASALRVGDIVYSPGISSKNTADVMSKDDAYICGLFVAEGCYAKKNLEKISSEFSLHKEETDAIEKINTFAQKYGRTAKTYTTNNSKGVSVRIFSKESAEFFDSVCYEYAANKCAKDIILNQPDDVFMSYLDGLIYGDGHEDSNGLRINCASINLVWQTAARLRSLGFSSYISKYVSVGGPTNRTNLSDGYYIQSEWGDKTRRRTALVDGSQVGYINKIESIEYDDYVYNFETEAGTYVANGIAVHNCDHVKNRTCHGEINVGLKPIEYSLVVQPAEPGAILLRCIASLQDYKKEFMNYGVEDFNEMLGKLSLEQAQHLNTIVKTACGDGDSCSASDRKKIITSFLKTAKLIDPITVSEPKSISMPRVTPTTENTELTSNKNTIPAWQVSNTKQDAQGTQDYTGTAGNTSAYQAATPDSKERGNVFVDDSDIIGKNLHDSNVDASRSGNNANINKQSRSLISTIMEDIMTESELKKRAELRRKLAYHQGGSDKGVEPSGFKAKPFSFNEDKHMKQTKTMGPVTGEFPGDMKTKEKLSRAELEERQIKRLAYFQGGAPKGVEPVGYKSKPFSHNEDKFMKQTKTMGPVTGEFPGDVKIKEKQKRAAYNGPALSTKLSWPKTAVGTINKSAALFEVFAGDKKVIAASGHEIFGNEINQNWDFFTSKEYGQEVCRQIRTAGIAHVAGLLKGAQAVDPMSAVPAPVGGAMGAPPAAPPAPPMPEMPMGGESAPEMGGEEHDESPEKQAERALVEMEAKIDEVRQAIGDLGGAGGDVNITVDKDGAEESGADEGALKLSHSVASQLKTAIAEMNESADELAMISETYAGASRLSKTNREDLDKIATASLREASSLLGKSGTLVKMASALSKQLTKVAQVAYSENAADDDAADEDDASDLMKEDEADDEAVDEADDEGVAQLMAHAMIMRRNRREQLVVEAAKKMDPKMKAKLEADKEKAAKARARAKAEEDDAKDKMKAKAEKEKAKAKAEAEAEKEKAAKKNKTAALRDMVDSAFTAKKEESDKDSYKIKLRRAYDVAIEMQKKGLIAISKTALDRQVDDIMEFDDKAFEAIKRTVANARSVSTVKTASDLGGVNVGSVDAPEGRPAKSTSELLTLLWK